MRSTDGRSPPSGPRPASYRFSAEVRPVVVRMIHASGEPALLMTSAGIRTLVDSARQALEHGALIFTDATMIASGITRQPATPRQRHPLPAGRSAVPELEASWRTTRSAAAVSLWAERLDGAVVAIGNAPTALFHLLE